ncbi:MAG: hypothetical protein HWE30_01530 [Methylocystaceae bacterium]|nr:hypothetical protein [Methylocystaceae bacterium]
MTSVVPPPPPPPPAVPGNAAALTVTLDAQASALLSRQALDSLITGLVKPPAPNGEMVLQTNLGPLQFKSPFNLPADAQATFKVVHTQPAVQIQLTHINGKPIAPNTPAARVQTIATQLMQNQTGQTTASAGQTALGQTSGPATLLNLNTASGMRAFVLPNPSPQSQPGQLQGQNLGQAASQQTATPQKATTTTGQNTQTPTSSVSSTSPPATQVGRNFFQTGNQLNVRLISIQQPGQQQVSTPSTPTTSSSGTSTVIIQGTINGQTLSRQPIVKIPQGQIALDTTAKMTDGTHVKMEVLSASKPAVQTSPPIQTTHNPVQTVGEKWPALDEAMQTLRKNNPTLLDHMTKAMLPKPDSRLALNMIFFLKALGRGNFKNWGDDQTMRALARGKPELLKKLEGDFQNLADKAKTPNSTDWKIAYMPMLNNNEINQIRIAHRDHRDEEKDAKEDPGVRFVIDLYLSRLGELQFDGLAKDKLRRFDLIVRAKNALPGFMRKEIHDIFANGMDAIGFDGKISFQVTPHFVDVDALEQQNSALNLGMLV